GGPKLGKLTENVIRVVLERGRLPPCPGNADGPGPLGWGQLGSTRTLSLAAGRQAGYAAGSYVTVWSGQLAAVSCRAATSVSSAARLQRSFVATHSETYRQCTSAAGGSHSEGSWSALERFERAVTATRLASAPWSLAYASRRCAVHADAPLSQLSARGTMWSMSRPEADVTHIWS